MFTFKDRNFCWFLKCQYGVDVQFWFDSQITMHSTSTSAVGQQLTKMSIVPRALFAFCNWYVQHRYWHCNIFCSHFLLASINFEFHRQLVLFFWGVLLLVKKTRIRVVFLGFTVVNPFSDDHIYSWKREWIFTLFQQLWLTPGRLYDTLLPEIWGLVQDFSLAFSCPYI